MIVPIRFSPLPVERHNSSASYKRVFRLALRNIVALILATLFCVSGANATTLQVDPDAPVWAHIGADALLYAHIGGGAIGLFAGVLAIVARKGGRVHRAVGSIFFAAMFVTYLIGAGVAPFLTDGQRPNFTAGVLALYLLVSGWSTARRGDFSSGRPEAFGLVIALIIVGLGFIFMQMGANSPTGTVDGSPTEAFFLFIIAGTFAAAGELNVLLRRGIAGNARIARHLWRMCVSWFIAAGSLFLGQPQVFPDWFNASPLPILLSFFPLIAMAIWLFIVRFLWPRTRTDGSSA